MWSHLFLFMKNTQPYIERIKRASLKKGVVLSNEDALEMFTRLVELTQAVYQPQGKALVWKKK